MATGIYPITTLRVSEAGAESRIYQPFSRNPSKNDPGERSSLSEAQVLDILTVYSADLLSSPEKALAIKAAADKPAKSAK